MKEGSNQRTQTIEHEKYFKEIGSKWILDLSLSAAMQHLSGFHAKIEQKYSQGKIPKCPATIITCNLQN